MASNSYSLKDARRKLVKQNSTFIDILDESDILEIEECSDEVIHCTTIQKFYESQSIFITGGTGFLGKILIEKLLRCCPKISKIFILVREKKNKTVNERMEELLQSSIFDSVPNKTYLKKKLHGIAGDCTLKNLGLSISDTKLLKEKVSIVFHVAATVRFNEKLKLAVATNIQSTSSIIDLCKSMKNLKSFIHVSTIYSNCFTPDIEEKFYNYHINHKELVLLVNNVPEEIIETITSELTKSWPNTYTFTKAIAENLVREECTDLPVAIFRPGIVTSSAVEPTPGWIDNYSGAAGITAAVASGLMRTFHCDPKGLANFVPVDLTINALIASAWDVTIQTTRRGESMLIYNFASINDAPMTWKTVRKNLIKNIDEYPLDTAFWRAILKITKNNIKYNFYILFFHLIPAYLIGIAMWSFGRETRILKTYEKIHTMATLLSHFAINSWQIRDENVQKLWHRLGTQDQQMFKFSMINFDWDTYFSNLIKGNRVFLFKDDLQTLDKSRIKYTRFRLLHQLIVASFIVFGSWSLWKVILIIISMKKNMYENKV